MTMTMNSTFDFDGIITASIWAIEAVGTIGAGTLLPIANAEISNWNRRGGFPGMAGNLQHRPDAFVSHCEWSGAVAGNAVGTSADLDALYRY